MGAGAEQREEVDQTVKKTALAGGKGRNEELLRLIPGLCVLDESEPLRQWLTWRNFSINRARAHTRAVRLARSKKTKSDPPPPSSSTARHRSCQ